VSRYVFGVGGGVEPPGLRVGFLYSDFFLSLMAWANVTRGQRSEIRSQRYGRWAVGSGQYETMEGRMWLRFSPVGAKRIWWGAVIPGWRAKRLPRATLCHAAGVKNPVATAPGSDKRATAKLAGARAGRQDACAPSSRRTLDFGRWTLDLDRDPVATAPGSDN
jgi:hypothetical protein